jgi:hypothetical protein
VRFQSLTGFTGHLALLLPMARTSICVVSIPDGRVASNSKLEKPGTF